MFIRTQTTRCSLLVVLLWAALLPAMPVWASQPPSMSAWFVVQLTALPQAQQVHTTRAQCTTQKGML